MQTMKRKAKTEEKAEKTHPAYFFYVIFLECSIMAQGTDNFLAAIINKLSAFFGIKQVNSKIV